MKCCDECQIIYFGLDENCTCGLPFTIVKQKLKDDDEKMLGVAQGIEKLLQSSDTNCEG